MIKIFNHYIRVMYICYETGKGATERFAGVQLKV